MTNGDFAPLSIVNNKANILSTSKANSFRTEGSVNMEVSSSNLQIGNPTWNVWRKVKNDLIEIMDTDDVIRQEFYILCGYERGEHLEVC